MRDELPKTSPSWIPLGIFLLVMLFTPLGRIWPLFVVGIGALIWLKRVRLETGLLWAGVAFAGGVLNAGAWSPATLAPTFRDEGADVQRLPENFKRLEVRGFNGFIRVTARRGQTGVRFERKSGASVTLERRGDTVVITTRRPFFSFNSGVNITLDIPENLEVNLQTSNGFVEVQGRVAKLTVKTSNDRIAVRDTGTADIRLETSNDDINLERLAGTLYARSSNGSIRLLDSSLSLDAQTDNASITLERLTLTNNTRSRAVTSNGSITVAGLNASSGLLIRGATSNARVDVNTPGLNVRLEDSRFEARRDGFGTAELELKTDNDRITVRP
jgi:Putative adhesin